MKKNIGKLVVTVITVVIIIMFMVIGGALSFAYVCRYMDGEKGTLAVAIMVFIFMGNTAIMGYRVGRYILKELF